MDAARCKMCDHTLQVSRDQTIASCQHCMGLQALPKLLDPQQMGLYERAEEYYCGRRMAYSWITSQWCRCGCGKQ